MTKLPAETVRDWATTALAKHVTGDDRSEPVVETILVRDGRYVGRAFRQAGWKAIWPAGEDLLQLFDPAGAWLGNVDIGTSAEPDDQVA